MMIVDATLYTIGRRTFGGLLLPNSPPLFQSEADAAEFAKSFGLDVRAVSVEATYSPTRGDPSRRWAVDGWHYVIS